MKIDNKELILRQLNIEEMKYVYDTYMTEHFPDDELKPFQLIKSVYDQGCYDALGIIYNNKIIGYAYFVKIDNKYLFDYFGITDQYRNLGIGSYMLYKIRTFYKDAECIIGEVEDYNLADPEQRTIQERRYNFYLRNGCVDTGLKVLLFDVDYIIIILSSNREIPTDNIKNMYLNIYKHVLPDKLFSKKVKIK